MDNNILKQYYDTYFAEIPVREFTWKYQMRDMIDEWIYCLVPIVIFAGMAYFGENWFDFIGIPGLICCGIYVLNLIRIILLRRTFTSYRLTRDHFVYTHGLFVQNVETLQLSDIVQMTLRRSWWEHLIHTGTLEIRFRSSVDLANHKSTLRIRGIGDYNEMFKQIDDYRNRHRLVLYFGF